MPQHEDHDDLAALDFFAHGSGTDDVEESDALDFSVAAAGDEEAAAEALNEYAPTEPQDAGTEQEALDSQTAGTGAEDEEEDVLEQFTVKVTNPPETVSVSALMDGRTQQIELSPKVTKMTESELADEILVLADLARQKGLAGQHRLLFQSDDLSQAMQEIGMEDSGETVRGIIEEIMDLPTQEQADEEQAKVFAARYAQDHG